MQSSIENITSKYYLPFSIRYMLFHQQRQQMICKNVTLLHYVKMLTYNTYTAVSLQYRSYGTFWFKNLVLMWFFHILGLICMSLKALFIDFGSSFSKDCISTLFQGPRKHWAKSLSCWDKPLLSLFFYVLINSDVVFSPFPW